MNNKEHKIQNMKTGEIIIVSSYKDFLEKSKIKNAKPRGDSAYYNFINDRIRYCRGWVKFDRVEDWKKMRLERQGTIEGHYNKKSCELINLETGETVKAETIKEFCDKVGLTKNDKLHITPILKMKRLHHKNWCLPEFYNEIRENFNIKDIYGNKYNISILDIVKKHGVGSISFMLKLKHGKIKCFQGLYLENTEINCLPPRNYKVNKYIFSKGKQKYVGKTQCEVAQKVGVSKSTIGSILHGTISDSQPIQYEGVETIQRKILK